MVLKKNFVLMAGEATVLDPPNKLETCAETEIVLGKVKGPVGYAFANLLGSQVFGHTRMLALLNVNCMVRPPTIMVPKVTMKRKSYIELFGGPVQAGTAKAVVDCVEEGIIPEDMVNDLVIIALIWLDPKATTEDNILYNKDEIYKNNYEATKLAIKRAVRNEPSIHELLEIKEKIRHCLYSPK